MARVLIVDDDAGVRYALTEVLDRMGHQTLAVETAARALEEAGRMEFDVLLTDIRMPEMDGIELLRRLREVAPRVVPIVITGYPSPETAQEALEERAVDYIIKPFQKGDLSAAIAHALQRRVVAEETGVHAKKQQYRSSRGEETGSAPKGGFRRGGAGGRIT
ncbi:MAG: response regulator [Chloroflexota bacterium]